MKQDILKHRSIFKLWKTFIETGKVQNSEQISECLLSSWKRSRKAGLKPYDFKPVFISGSELEKRKKQRLDLINITKPYTRTIHKFVNGPLGLVLLSDSDGIVLDVLGDKDDPRVPSYLNPGLDISEDKFGTFSAGTALIMDHAVQIWAAEHYVKSHHSWCSCSDTIHDENGKIIAVFTLILPWNRMSTHTLGMVAAVAGAIERQSIIEQSLKEKNILLNRQQNIIELINNGIVVLDTEGKIRSINNNAKMMLKTGSEDPEGKNFSDIVISGFDYKKFLRKRENINNREASLHLNDSVFRCMMSAISIKNENTSGTEGIILNFTPIESVRKLINKVNASSATLTFSDLTGSSGIFIKTVKEAKIAGRSNSNVLLLGESGTGKELFAQSIHNYGDRRHNPFIAVNCGALPRNLIESELFGYEGGAFTGSKKEGHPGKFELADKGTIFLDEIGDMPLEAQVHLLRVLETGTITRIGGKYAKKTDVRIIAATNKDLWKAVNEKTFREDLFYRINVLTINIPPLRERSGDVRLLTDFFIKKFAFSLKKPIGKVDPGFYAALESHLWPGNVRELENIVERAVNIVQSDVLSISELPDYLLKNMPGHENKPDTPLKKGEYEIIVSVLKEKKGNLRQSAKTLGIARSTLYKKLDELSIDPSEYR